MSRLQRRLGPGLPEPSRSLRTELLELLDLRFHRSEAMRHRALGHVDAMAPVSDTCHASLICDWSIIPISTTGRILFASLAGV